MVWDIHNALSTFLLLRVLPKLFRQSNGADKKASENLSVMVQKGRRLVSPVRKSGKSRSGNAGLAEMGMGIEKTREV